MRISRRTAARREAADLAHREPSPRIEDEIAVARYEYLLRHTRTKSLEWVHTRAFAALTETQRDLLFDGLLTRALAERPPRTGFRAPASARAARSHTGGSLRRWFGLNDTDQRSGSSSGDPLLGAIYALGPAIGVPFFWFAQPPRPPDEPTDERRGNR